MCAPDGACGTPDPTEPAAAPGTPGAPVPGSGLHSA
jgi:hypothetical protein